MNGAQVSPMSGRLAVCYAGTLLRQLKFTTGRDVETGGIRNRAAAGLGHKATFGPWSKS